MADPDDKTRHEGVSPDGRPRRQPPIIDVEAVEVSLDGSRTRTAGSGTGASLSGARGALKRIVTFVTLLSPTRLLPPVKFAVIGSVGVIAAIVGGALWIYLAPHGADGQRNAAGPEAASPIRVAEPAARPEAIVTAPPSQASPPPYPPPQAGQDRIGDLASRMAALDAMVAPLADRIVALERAVRDAADAARVAGERADKAASLFDVPPPSPPARAGEGDEQTRAQQNDRSALGALANRVATLESRQAALQQKLEGLDRLASATIAPDKAIRIATVAMALRSAVERNGPFTVELAAARSLALDERALAQLEPFAASGLPTRSELFRSLSTLVPELRRLSAPSSRDVGYLDRLQASALKMLNIRPVRDEPGDDPATVMSRIEFKMPQQDIEDMLAELDKLPAPARGLAQAWRTTVLARQAALESARLIATASLARLGEPAVRGPSPQ